MVSVLASAGHKNGRRAKNLETQYTIEMLNITKRFPGIIANDNITLKLKKGEIHALLGENGAGKSTLMSVLFGLYQPEEGEIHKDGRKVEIRDPNDANALGIGMVHQHFKLVECFSVLDNIILGVEPNKLGFLQKQNAREKVLELSEKYGLHVDPDAFAEITERNAKGHGVFRSAVVQHLAGGRIRRYIGVAGGQLGVFAGIPFLLQRVVEQNADAVLIHRHAVRLRQRAVAVDAGHEISCGAEQRRKAAEQAQDKGGGARRRAMRKLFHFFISSSL